MTPEQEIKPAMTPDEWARVNHMPQGGTVIICGPPVEGLRFSGVVISPSDAPTLIAKLNDALPDESPHKITAADVALLDTLIGLRDDGGYPMLDMYPIAPLRAKLAAILPPK